MRVGDFGLCRRAAKNAVPVSYSKDGTDTYMPPEVMLGAKLDATKVDVWCTGLVLYELMALSFLSERPGLLGALVINDKEEVNKLVHGPGGVPKIYSSELTEILKSMLNPDPTQRPSMDAVLRKPKVKGALADWWVSSSANKTKTKARPRSHSGAARSAAAAAIAAAAAGGETPARPSLLPTTPPRGQAETAAETPRTRLVKSVSEMERNDDGDEDGGRGAGGDEASEFFPVLSSK